MLLGDDEIHALPDRSGVYLQCHAVYTAGTLHMLQCTCSIGCSYTAHTLPASGSVPAVYVQPTLQLHWNYTAYTLHFGLGMVRPILLLSRNCKYQYTHSSPTIHHKFNHNRCWGFFLFSLLTWLSPICNTHVLTFSGCISGQHQKIQGNQNTCILGYFMTCH